MEHVNNNLSLCLAAIAGKVDSNTVNYYNGLEYQLLKIAGMTEESGGGDDTPSENKYTAKKVTTYVPNQEMGRDAYMVTVDLGIEEIPYEAFGINADIDGHVATVSGIERDYMVSQATEFEGDTINFSQDDINTSCVLTCPESKDSMFISSIRAFFIHGNESLEAQNFKLQMFIYMGLFYVSNDEAEMAIDITIEENASGGGDTEPDIYTAVKVATTRPGSPSSITEKAMMTTIDLGIEDFPYPNFDLRVFAEIPSQGGEYVIKDRNEDDISFMGAAFEKGANAIVFTQTDLNRSLVLSPVGTVLNDLSDSNYIRAFFIRSKGEEAPKTKLQLFIYHAADEDPEEAQIAAHVFFDEIKEGGGGIK